MVGDVWELGALLGEASTYSRRDSPGFSALAKDPRVAGADVGSLEVSLKNPD
jgi:hypothetical protein